MMSIENMDLSFLRTLAGSNLPRQVPVGPAFQLVLAYQASGLLVLDIPPCIHTRAGNTMQPDAVVTSITESGRAATASTWMSEEI